MVSSTLLTSAVWFSPLKKHYKHGMRYCVFFLLAAHTAIAGDSALPDFLPPGIKVMFGVQVRRIATSPLAQGLPADASAMGGAGDWQKIVSLAGFDSIKDIEEVLMASTGAGGEGQTPPMLLIARGNFNAERIAAHAKAYHGVPVLEGVAGSTGVVAMLDTSTAIMGDLTEVHAAIDRRGAGAPLDPTLAATVASLRGRYDIWGLGDKPSSLIPAGAKPDGLDSGFDSIDHFQFGISLTHGLELGAELHAASAKDVEKLTASVGFIEMMIKLQQPGPNSPKFDVSAKNGTIRLALTIPEDEFSKMIETQRALLRQNPKQQAAHTSMDTSIKISAPVEPASVKGQAVRAPATDGGTTVFALPGKRP
jgi:hypothetical protein